MQLSLRINSIFLGDGGSEPERLRTVQPQPTIHPSVELTTKTDSRLLVLGLVTVPQVPSAFAAGIPDNRTIRNAIARSLTERTT